MWTCFGRKNQWKQQTSRVAVDARASCDINQIAMKPKQEMEEERHGIECWSHEGTVANMVNLLPSDVLIYEIIARIAMQDEGPKNVCRLSCVCKFLYEASNEAEILRKTKISLTSFFFSPLSYQNFVYKCATIGNLHAMATIGACGGYRVGVEGDLHFVTERLYAVYFRGIILFESSSTRNEAIDYLWACFLLRDLECFANFKKNARKYLSRFGVNRPLERPDHFCDNKYCAWSKYQEGYPIGHPCHIFCCDVACRFACEYELFRIASLEDC